MKNNTKLIKALHKVVSDTKIKGSKIFIKKAKKILLENLNRMLPSLAIKEKGALTGSIYLTLDIPAKMFDFLDPSKYFEDKTYSGEMLLKPITIDDYSLPYSIRISDHIQKPGGGMRYTGEDFERLGSSNIDIAYSDFVESKQPLETFIKTKLEKLTEDLKDRSFIEMEIR
jgi:hypothetical protein